MMAQTCFYKYTAARETGHETWSWALPVAVLLKTHIHPQKLNRFFLS